jgi:hypothetical protein
VAHRLHCGAKIGKGRAKAPGYFRWCGEGATARGRSRPFGTMATWLTMIWSDISAVTRTPTALSARRKPIPHHTLATTIPGTPIGRGPVVTISCKACFIPPPVAAAAAEDNHFGYQGWYPGRFCVFWRVAGVNRMVKTGLSPTKLLRRAKASQLRESDKSSY